MAMETGAYGGGRVVNADADAGGTILHFWPQCDYASPAGRFAFQRSGPMLWTGTHRFETVIAIENLPLAGVAGRVGHVRLLAVRRFRARRARSQVRCE